MIDNQTEAEYNKNILRIENLIKSCTVNGVFDEEKAIKKATNDAAKIKTEWKAINRAKLLHYKGYDKLAECFFKVAHTLGNDGKQQFRNYKLAKLQEIHNFMEIEQHINNKTS